MPARQRPRAPELRVELPGGCRLRPVEARDASELYARIEAGRAELSRWMPWAAGQTLARTREFIRDAQAGARGGERLNLVIVCAGRIAGTVGLASIDRLHRSATVGYWLAADHQGRGIATRATAALVSHAFASWNLNRIEIRAATENRRSRAIPVRLGFRHEGTLREAQWLGERVVDLAVYSVLAREWDARAAG